MKSVRATLLTLVVGLTAVLVLGSCTTEPSKTTSTADNETATTSTTIATLNTYSDPDYGFSFEYPSDWDITQNAPAEVSAGSQSVKDIAVYDPQGSKAGGSPANGVQISVYKLLVSVDETILDAVKAEIEQVLANMENQDPSWRRLENLTSTHVGGVPGFKISYEFSLQGTPAKSAMYFLFDKDVQYQISFQTTADDWSSYQDEFSRVLETFSLARAIGTYTDPDYHFSFQYPGTWKVEATKTPADVSSGSAPVKDLTVYDPQGAVISAHPVNLVHIAIYELRSSVDKMGMSSVKTEIQSLLRDIERQDPSWQRLEDLTETQVANLPGFKIAYDFSLQDTPARTAFYFLFHKNVEFQLLFQTVAEDWSSYQEKFGIVLDSFSLATPVQ
ncbi:MAG: PsbP-related protein [Thermoleophilia bacterium]|nr:PsbP-related protein [Thermoleophilia bacterium]